MNFRTLFNTCLFALLFALFSPQGFTAQYTTPLEIPVDVFSELPVSGYQLSPSGQKIGFFVPVEGRRALIFQNLDGTDRQMLPPWEEQLELVSFFWKTEEIFVFKVHMTLNRREFIGRTTETRIFSYNLATNTTHWLGRPRPARFGNVRDTFVSQHERVIDRLIHDPEHILVSLDFELQGYPVIYRVNVNKGSRKKIHARKTGINNWVADEEGVVRFGWGYRNNGSTINYRYRTADGKWRNMTKSGLFENFVFEDLGPGVGQLYMSGTNEFGTGSMLLVDVASGEVIEEVFSHPKVDIDSNIYHPATGKVVGVYYTDDFVRARYFDKSMTRLQKGLENALPGMIVSITDKARDANLYLILAYSDTDPGQYFLYNRDTKHLDYFASYRSNIDAELSAGTSRVDVPVSDGSEIPAYLTIPKGREAKNLPAIVLPHGGPEARDSADCDYEAQFYASRGYAVLKPNFRGSTGYGAKFRIKGEKQWGGLMQQDVTDATRWLISQGIADPERICIVGSSYGGYAAMMGLIQEPGLYACGISVNGVMNLPALKTQDRRTIGGRDWAEEMGLVGTKDTDVSPQQQAKRIMDPVLLIAATNDARIPYEQTRKLHKRLKRLKRDTTYVEIDTGTHHMLNAESRLVMLSAAEKFLAKHLQ